MWCCRRSATLWVELGCVNCCDTITGCDQQSNEIRAVSHTCLATSSWQRSSSLLGTPHKSQKEIQFLVSFACANLTKWLCVIGQWSVTCFVLRTDRVAIKNCVLQLLVVPKSCFFKACTHIYAVTTWLKWDRALRVSKSAALILILHLPDSLCYRNFLEPYHVNG